MIRTIRLPSTLSNFELVTTLDGEDYRLGFLWNSRESRWYWRLYDSSGTEILAWRKLVADSPLIAHLTSEAIPPGSLWCLDSTGRGMDPGLRDLGERHWLMYVDEDSLT